MKNKPRSIFDTMPHGPGTSLNGSATGYDDWNERVFGREPLLTEIELLKAKSIDGKQSQKWLEQEETKVKTPSEINKFQH